MVYNLFRTDKLPSLSKISFQNGSILIFNLSFMINNTEKKNVDSVAESIL